MSDNVEFRSFLCMQAIHERNRSTLAYPRFLRESCLHRAQIERLREMYFLLARANHGVAIHAQGIKKTENHSRAQFQPIPRDLHAPY